MFEYLEENPFKIIKYTYSYYIYSWVYEWVWTEAIIIIKLVYTYEEIHVSAFFQL